MLKRYPCINGPDSAKEPEKDGLFASGAREGSGAIRSGLQEVTRRPIQAACFYGGYHTDCNGPGGGAVQMTEFFSCAIASLR